LHGYTHIHTTNSSGIIGLNKRSEFAGLSRALQEEKIIKAIKIFKKNGVTPNCWIAPSHSFDKTTVEILVSHGIFVISDGFFNQPINYLGAIWVPQQLWKFESKNHGLWTICLHHNSWDGNNVSNFEDGLKMYIDKIVSINEALTKYPPRKLMAQDEIISKYRLTSIHVKKHLKYFIDFFKSNRNHNI
jgi:hypothetical protein